MSHGLLAFPSSAERVSICRTSGPRRGLRRTWRWACPTSPTTLVRTSLLLSFLESVTDPIVVFLGPGGPLSHGSALPSIEHQTKYIARLLYKMQTEGYKAVVPSQAATREFISHMHKFNERTVWSGDCNSWFKGGRSSTAAANTFAHVNSVIDVKENKPLCHPGSRTHWFHMLTKPRWEDWEWERVSENRFSYLGNGWTTWERKDQDLSCYLDDPDSGYESLRY